jgi:hypothetical protein
MYCQYKQPGEILVQKQRARQRVPNACIKIEMFIYNYIFTDSSNTSMVSLAVFVPPSHHLVIAALLLVKGDSYCGAERAFGEGVVVKMYRLQTSSWIKKLIPII